VSSYSASPLPPKPDPVRAFRGEQRSSALHALELLLIVILSAHLIFVPWAIGSRMPWAQLVSCGFGVVALAVSLWSRRYCGELAPEGEFTLHMWPRLLKFPLFWIGLAFLGYVLTQALNPAWERIATPAVWFIKRIDHIEWLPSSVAAPFERMNAWRMLAVWTGVWASACAIWTGFTRRTSVQRVLNAVIINGSVLALIGILQKSTGTAKILWCIGSPAHYFHSTFVYKNHAGAYFNIIFTLSLGVAAWNHMRGLRRLERSTPAPVYLFAAIVSGVSVFMSGSRTAMILLASFIVVGGLIYLFWRSRSESSGGSTATSVLIATLAVGFVALAAVYLNLQTSIEQIRNVFERDRFSAVESRIHIRDATWELFRDESLTGWGAGSFRHTFPIHQQNYPEIYRPFGTVMNWEYAHNDFMQILAEVGILGVIPLLMSLGWFFRRLLRAKALSHPGFLLITIGLGLTMAHAWVDFPLSNTAILTTFGLSWVLLVRWAELERSRGRGAPAQAGLPLHNRDAPDPARRRASAS
jgi:O-antigen ligase